MTSNFLSTDFDGTLVDHDALPSVTTDLFEALAALRERGVRWAVNTGRELGHIVEGLNEFGFPIEPDFVLTAEREVFRQAARHRHYAHGGLNGERDAEATFARWLPALFAARKFPVFLMWESDLLSTIGNRLADLVETAPRPAGGPLDSLSRWWDERLEGLFAPAGCAIWDEMKQNAAAISGEATSGARLLFRHLGESAVATQHPLRIHLVGHSAGAIAHAFIVDRLAALEWEFASVTFLAPALRVDRFRERVLPWIVSKHVKRYRHYHLADSVEQQDATMRPLLGYGRSLLYLVSRSFEGGAEVPILGMERHFPADIARLRAVDAITAPSEASRSTTHGGFVNDPATIASVIAEL